MLVIVDKDGTLVEPASGSKFVQNPTDQRLLPGVAEHIAELAGMGATIVIASNQRGVAAGHKSLEDAIAEMRFCLKLLPEINYALFSPDFEGEELWKVEHPSLGRGDAGICDRGSELGLYGRYRKPEPGMLNYASELYPDAIMIGDRPEDAQAAAAGIPFVDAEAWRTGAIKILTTGITA